MISLTLLYKKRRGRASYFFVLYLNIFIAFHFIFAGDYFGILLYNFRINIWEHPRQLADRKETDYGKLYRKDSDYYRRRTGSLK